jgi:hypothetical protein
MNSTGADRRRLASWVACSVLLAPHARAAPNPLTGVEEAAAVWSSEPAAAPSSAPGAAGAGRGAAPIPGALYATSGSALYTIDAETGESTLVGSHGSVSFALGAIAFESSGGLYGFDLEFDLSSTASFYVLNPATGAKTTIGLLGVDFVFEGGLAIGPTGRFIGANQNNALAARLIELNPATGDARVIGPATGEERDLNGLTFDGSTLYALDRTSSTLGVVDLATGAGDPSDLYVLDKATGAGTFVASLSIAVFDLAFAPPDPPVHLYGDSFETTDPSRWSGTID